MAGDIKDPGAVADTRYEVSECAFPERLDHPAGQEVGPVTQHPSFRRRPLAGRILGSALALVFLGALIPATGTAAVTITAYKINSNLPSAGVPADGPSTLQAGAFPNAGSYSTFGYTTPGVDDVQIAITNFAPGLLGNPESVPKCPEADLQAPNFGATCPAGSAIGTSRLDSNAAGSFAGTVYNAAPLGNEPGRLGVVTPAGGLGTLISSIPFEITPRGARDYGLTGTLSDITPLPGALQVTGLSFLLNGATNNYVRNPTSCGTNTSTGEANSYADETFTDGPAYAFTTTGCDQTAFSPSVAIQVGDRGTTKLNGYPPVIVKITQPSGQADIRLTKITLPSELNTNNTAYKLCTQAQADADSCPANSKFGNVSATSPFLSAPLSGPVYLIQQSSNSLPGLLLDLYGRAHVKIQTTTQLVNNRLIQSLTTDSPQLPVSALTVALNGGKTTGVFQNRSDLCFGSSEAKFNTVNAFAKLTGWNGKATADAKLDVAVAGCGPGVTSGLSRPTGSRPKLTVTTRRHPDSPKMKELTVTLGSNLSLVRSKLNQSSGSVAALGGSSFKYVNRRTLKVTGLPSGGASRVTLRLRDGAIRVSNRSLSLLKRGRSRRFNVAVKQTPVTGLETKTKASFSAKR